MHVELIKAIDEFLEKAGRKSRSLSNYHKLVRENKRKMTSTAREYLNFMIDEILKSLPKMKKAKPRQMVERLLDWDSIENEGIKIFKPELLNALTIGGKAVVERKILKQERFDPIGVAAITWVNNHGATLVKGITDKTMDAMREFFQAGIDKGWSVPQMARAIRPYVGLTPRQLTELANYEEWLIINKPEYSSAKIKSMAETRAKRLHNDRAMLIGRTESASALSEGTRQGYDQMGIKRLERVEDPRCCDICSEYNGRIYTVTEAEGVLPEHPGCEGVWVAA